MSAPAPHLLPSYRDYSHGELIADGVVHAMALVAGVIAFSVLFQKVAMYGPFGDGVAMAIYAAGFFFLFGFSCAYNMAPPSAAKAILRRFDHASIYLMIGGTYTALLSQARASLSVVALAAAVWIAALTGASLKLFLPGRFDRFSVRLYLALAGRRSSRSSLWFRPCRWARLRSYSRAASSIRSASLSSCGKASSSRTPSGTPESPSPQPVSSPA